MTTFWFIAVAMAILAVLFVLIPLLRHRPEAERATDISQDEINARIFRERLADLDNDHTQGHIDEAQYQQLRNELERTLLTDIPKTAGNRAAGNRLVNALAVFVVLLLPLLGLGYYYKTGYQGEAHNWLALNEQLDDIVAYSIHRPFDLPEAALKDLPGFTRVLQARVLREALDDPDSLFLLGMCYLQLGQPQLAEEVLARANQLDSQQTDYQLAYAQAMVMANDGRLTPQSEELLRTVLGKHPDHQGAMMLLGFASFQSGDYQQAIDAWTPLLAVRDPNSEAAQMLRSSLDQARRMLAQNAQTATPTPVKAGAPAADAPREIVVKVSLASDIEAQVSPQDTLFVFAKAASGPPMPLAVVRESAANLPLTVTLDDSKGMSPALKLSDFEQVVVSARISKSGNAMAQADDLQGPSVPLSLNSGPKTVDLVIGGAATTSDTEPAAAPPPAPARTTPVAEAKLKVSVALDPTLKDKISFGDVLFVFAKAVNGPAMPLAVVKRSAGEFPLTVVLDDSQAMMPNMKLSDFSEVMITARISRTGNASATPGDLQGVSPPVTLGNASDISLTIDQIVE